MAALQYESAVAAATASDMPDGGPPRETEFTLIAQYFRDVRRYPLLSHEREITLAQHIQEGSRHWQDISPSTGYIFRSCWPGGRGYGAGLPIGALCWRRPPSRKTS